MKRITEGHGTTTIWLDGLFVLGVGWVKSEQPFQVTVCYYFEDALSGNLDEPPTEELFAILLAFPLGTVRLHHEDCLYTVIYAEDDFYDNLSVQGEKHIETEIRKQCQGDLREPSYMGLDNNRPRVSERARQELGWDLTGDNYER